MTDARHHDLDPRLRARIADLPEEVSPEHDLWMGIRARLDADRVRSIAAPHAPVRVRRSPAWAARAAAAVALIAGTAMLTRWMSVPETTTVVVLDSAAAPRTADGLVAYERTAEELTVAFEARTARLDPATVEVLVRSMRTIDSAITEARAALARDPASPAIRGYVEAVYRQKIDFLRRANDVARLWEL